jgi:hypothetical protein
MAALIANVIKASSPRAAHKGRTYGRTAPVWGQQRKRVPLTAGRSTYENCSQPLRVPVVDAERTNGRFDRRVSIRRLDSAEELRWRRTYEIDIPTWREAFITCQRVLLWRQTYAVLRTSIPASQRRLPDLIKG